MTLPVLASQRFSVGPYEVIAQPIASSSQMLRYTVYSQGKRVGSMVSYPAESDCREMEFPREVPPLRAVTPTYSFYAKKKPT